MSSTGISDKIVERVLEVLPTKEPGLTHQQIHERVGMWSIITIKHAVRQLREEGLVIRHGTHSAPEFVRAAL